MRQKMPSQRVHLKETKQDKTRRKKDELDRSLFIAFPLPYAVLSAYSLFPSAAVVVLLLVVVVVKISCPLLGKRLCASGFYFSPVDILLLSFFHTRLNAPT